VLEQAAHYRKIAQAIEFIAQNFKDQPSLAQIAAQVNLSPFHFQRLFSDWVGVSPKKFIQYTSIEYAKQLLKEQQLNVSDTAYHVGLSGSSRLHDLFVNIEGMTPGEYKNGGASLVINYQFCDSAFGSILIASTAKGICYLMFNDDQDVALAQLKQSFEQATFLHASDEHQRLALAMFEQSNNAKQAPLKLHLKGSDFQLKVWQALLKIPLGQLSTYGHIATMIDKPKAARAVGSAIAANPIAFLIPCHRVIQASGNFGGYRWGGTRKSVIIGWEGALLNNDASVG
jgi:AraC family transcriptional regulator of adaptative response/methylated-DNA-[protein]-cysteine methyltransferase